MFIKQFCNIFVENFYEYNSVGFCSEIDLSMLLISVFSRILIYCLSQLQLLPKCDCYLNSFLGGGNKNESRWGVKYAYLLWAQKKLLKVPSSLILRLNQVDYNKLEVMSKLQINPVWEDLDRTSGEWASFWSHMCAVSSSCYEVPMFCHLLPPSRKSFPFTTVLMLFSSSSSTFRETWTKKVRCLIWTSVWFSFSVVVTWFLNCVETQWILLWIIYVSDCERN